MLQITIFDTKIEYFLPRKNLPIWDPISLSVNPNLPIWVQENITCMLCLVSVSEQAGLSLTWLKTLKTGFLVIWLNCDQSVMRTDFSFKTMIPTRSLDDYRQCRLTGSELGLGTNPDVVVSCGIHTIVCILAIKETLFRPFPAGFRGLFDFYDICYWSLCGISRDPSWYPGEPDGLWWLGDDLRCIHG